MPVEEHVKGPKHLAKGTKELLLIAQDLTYYGLDIYKEAGLAKLVNRLSDIEEYWVDKDFTTAFKWLPDGVLDANERQNV